MKNCYWLLVIGSFLIWACKEKNKDIDQAGALTARDFINGFDERAIPFNLEDTTLVKKDVDSLQIDNEELSMFVPDSTFYDLFGKKTLPKIYPIGRISVRNLETYVLVKAVSQKRKAAYVLVFDKNDSFASAMPLITGEIASNTGYSAGIDRRHTITKTMLQRKANGEIIYSKNAFVYNQKSDFTLILTESNDVSKLKDELINPIDTMPSSFELSGDYLQDKRNFVSVRDGKNDKQIEIFIHFEKEGACKGELKGTATMISDKIARYNNSGDPCILELHFSNNQVTLKELKGCGAYRGIKCFFEGRYKRKS